LIRPKAGVALVWMMRMAKFLGLDEVKEWLEGGDIPGARLPGCVDALDWRVHLTSADDYVRTGSIEQNACLA